MAQKAQKILTHRRDKTIDTDSLESLQAYDQVWQDRDQRGEYGDHEELEDEERRYADKDTKD